MPAVENIPNGAINRLSLDLDNVMAQTGDHMKRIQRSRGTYVPGHFEPVTPDGKLPPEYLAARQSYLRDSSQIHRLPFYRDTVLSMWLLRKHFKIHVNTARLENQRLDLQGLFRARGVTEYVSSLDLRLLETDDPEDAKVQRVKAEGIKYAVEDQGHLAVRLSKEGCRVALIHRAWNRWVPNSQNIRVYGRVLDFALDLEYFGSPEALFEAHLKEIGHSKNMNRAFYRVHRTRIFIA